MGEDGATSDTATELLLGNLQNKIDNDQIKRSKALKGAAPLQR